MKTLVAFLAFMLIIWVSFSYGQTSEGSLALVTPTLSSPYPNPSVNEATVDYTAPENFQQAYIRVYNFLGKEQIVLSLHQASDSQKLPIADLPSGMYFCSLEVDGKVYVTRRLIVSH